MTPKRKLLLYRLVSVALPVLAAALVWHFAGLSQYKRPSDVAHALQALAARPYGLALVPLGFAALAALFVPVNALIAGVALSFDPLHGLAFALSGGLLGASVSYGLGLLFGPRLVDVFRGPKVDRVIDRLRARPFRTSLLLHLLPVGNFAAANLLAGSLKVPFVGFLLGTALGLLPGVVLFIVLAESLAGGAKGLIAGAIGAAALVAFAVVLRRLAKESARA